MQVPLVCDVRLITGQVAHVTAADVLAIVTGCHFFVIVELLPTLHGCSNKSLGNFTSTRDDNLLLLQMVLVFLVPSFVILLHIVLISLLIPVRA